jgi:predicted DNA-binding protein
MVSVRIPEEMNGKLTELVNKLGITKNAFILSLINKELHKEKSTV